MTPDTLIFVANSPGEIAGWLAPLVHEARQRWPHCRIVLQLLACEFATGAEKRVAHDLVGIEEVISFSMYLPMLLFRGARYRNALIIHLGGDMFYSVLIARRWKLPLWIYIWGRRHFDKAFSGYFVRHQGDVKRLTGQGIPEQKIRIVGDLVADATKFTLGKQMVKWQAEQSQKLQQGKRPLSNSEEGPLISFLPGSREREVQCLAPFFLIIAQHIRKTRPNCRFQLIISPFIATEDMYRLLTSYPTKEIDGTRGRFDGRYLWSNDNTRIKVVHSNHLVHLSQSTLGVTIPGTKTSELGCLGIPMVTILPFNRPDLLPLTGLLGLLDFLPFGKYLKAKLCFVFAKRPRFVALPNILAQRLIVPELMGFLTFNQVLDSINSLLDNPEALKEQAEELHRLYEPFIGATGKVFDILGDDSQWPTR